MGAGQPQASTARSDGITSGLTGLLRKQVSKDQELCSGWVRDGHEKEQRRTRELGPILGAIDAKLRPDSEPSERELEPVHPA